MKKENELSMKIQVLYGIGVSYAIVDQIFAQWVLYYYLPPANSTLQPLLPPIFISIALIMARFVDVIFDPLVGYWSDRFSSKWGRRRPFIAVGAIPLVLMTIAYFYPIKTNYVATFIYLAIVGSLFFIFYTIVGAPYNSLIPEISKTRSDRLNLSTWQSVFRLLYTAAAMILPGVLINYFGKGNDEKGIRGMVILLSGVALIGMFITVFSIDERKYSGGKTSNSNLITSLKSIFKNRAFIYYLFGFMFFFLGFNTLRASMNYYVEDIMGYGKVAITLASAILFAISAICFYPINKIAKKIGYRILMLISLGMLVVFSFGLFFLVKIIPANFGFIIFGLMGIPISGAAFIFPPAMLSEISAAAAKNEKIQIEGMFFGIQGFFLKIAFLLSIAVLPLILVSGAEISILESFITMPEEISKVGIYRTSLFSIIAFMISFIFYFLYNEPKYEGE